MNARLLYIITFARWVTSTRTKMLPRMENIASLNLTLPSQKLPDMKIDALRGGKYEEQRPLEEQVMKGIITLNSSVKALYDMGATQTFITIKIIQKFGVTTQLLDVALNAISPLEVASNLCYY